VGQFDDAEESSDDEVMESFASVEPIRSQFSDAGGNDAVASSPLGGVLGCDFDGMDTSGDDGFSLDELPIGRIIQDTPVSRESLLTSIHPTGRGVVLTKPVAAHDEGLRNSVAPLKCLDIIIGVDGDEVFDPTTLHPTVEDLLVAQKLGRDDVIYIDVLRLSEGIGNVIKTKGPGFWYDLFTGCCESVVASVCKHNGQPFDLAVLRRAVSIGFDDVDFDYDSALSSLCLELSADRGDDVSLEGLINLTNCEVGNASLAMMEFFSLLQNHCNDQSQCPPVARSITTFLLRRTLQFSNDELVCEVEKMLPTAFSGIHALLNKLGAVKARPGDDAPVDALFAHGSPKPRGGGKFAYQPLSIDTRSESCGFTVSCFSRWYGEELGAILYKVVRFNQPGQVGVPWVELDESGEPISVSSDAPGTRILANVCISTQVDSNGARREITSKFPSNLKHFRVNQNVVHKLFDSAIKACVMEKYFQLAFRHLGISSYYKFPPPTPASAPVSYTHLRAHET